MKLAASDRSGIARICCGHVFRLRNRENELRFLKGTTHASCLLFHLSKTFCAFCSALLELFYFVREFGMLEGLRIEMVISRLGQCDVFFAIFKLSDL